MSPIPQGIKDVPYNLDPSLREFLQQIRNAIKRLENTVVAPQPATNLKATAKAGGIIVQFTRSDGDAYILYSNDTPSINGARRIDLGLAAEFTDEIGQAAFTRYYWIKAKKGQMESVMAGPVSATTLALNATITPPLPPPASQTIAKSDETGNYETGRPTSSIYEKV
jgi:hypothetical protein